jgi:hypothetical protein
VARLLPRLAAAFPTHRIILRPHPSENAGTWKAIIQGMERVEVARQGSAVPWILAADLLIHPYCTTGVEAFALGRPAICWRPTESPVLDNYLSPLVNLPARTLEDVVAQAQAVIAVGDGFAYPAEYRTLFGRSFAAQAGGFAAERIMAALTARFGVVPADTPRWRPGRGYSRFVLSKKHNRRLVPALTPADLTARLERYAHALGRNQRFTIAPCGDRVFHIHGHPEQPGAAETKWVPRWVRRLAGAVPPT